LNFLDIFSKKILKIKFHEKIRPAEDELFDPNKGADRQTDKTKLRIAFLNFAKGPKNSALSDFDIFRRQIIKFRFDVIPSFTP
jgi:hypothetical protein